MTVGALSCPAHAGHCFRYPRIKQGIKRVCVRFVVNLQPDDRSLLNVNRMKIRIMSTSGTLARMFLALCFLLLAVSTTRAHMYFSAGDETKTGLLGPAEYGPEEGANGDQTAAAGDADKAVIPDWKKQQLHAGLNALKHSLQAEYSTARKRSWLPGTQTGLFGKRGGYWPASQNQLEKRQLWANQQAGLFGKRDDGREQTLPRWTVKRSAEESEFGRARRKGGIPHVFQSGGIFGKRSAEDLETARQ